MKKPTHKERILALLEDAGDPGVSSRVLYREFMGRGAARIGELRAEGYDIDFSERDPADPRFCIYKLLEVGAGRHAGKGIGALGGAACASPASDSDERSVGGRGEPQRTSGAANATPGAATSEARLFQLPAMSAQTNQEAA